MRTIHEGQRLGPTWWLAIWLLGWVQDDIAEDVSWGTPWPGPPDGHEQPDPEVEFVAGGVFVGYVDSTGWVTRSPKLPLPERWAAQPSAE